jgi:hypothetical protein
MTGSIKTPMPVRSGALGLMLLMTMNTAMADKTSAPTPTPPPPASPASASSSSPDMDLLEFLGSVETEGNSGQEVLTAIDTGLLPDAPEEPTHDAH